ncbi:uroporphyrinogen-III synthase [Halothiobacillus sp. DCM-1]|uniref:uroporphyrinogen-III synthase n=1 Tax=Halothiobacillus sp. DCM-1 TaxID=3112558 RepID=UPI00324C8B0F
MQRPSKVPVQPCCVLTRPAGLNAGLRARLQADLPGLPVCEVPLLQFAPNAQPTAAQAALAECSAEDWLIFVSPRAVEFTHALVPLSDLPCTRIACVGAATADTVRRLRPGSDPIVPHSTSDSEGLLAALDPSEFVGRRVWLLRGQDGREWLGEQLQQWGARVTPLSVYQRQCAPLGDWPSVPALWILTAPAALHCLHAAIGRRAEPDRPRLLHSPLVLINARARALARDLGFTGTITLSQAPDDAALSHACAQAWHLFTMNQESAP